MIKELRILMLEDTAEDAEFIERALRNDHIKFVSKRVEDRTGFTNSLHEFNPDIVLSDHSLPQFDSLSALHIVKENYSHIPFILVTGSVSEEFAVKCIKSGAEDYVLKNNLIRLPSIIENALNKKDLKAENLVIKNLNTKLNSAYEVIAQKNKDIIDSINYARNVQEALMQRIVDINDYFSESFVLLLPKDVLSGDFYWVRNIGERTIIAAVDCTGHGVPGALLTIMGMNILHSAVGVHKISSPPAILKFLDEDLNRKLSHRGGGKIINDGMDMSICEIDRKEMIITVSGANRPVYIIRDGELQSIITDKYSIGSGDPAKQFDAKHVPIKKGDMVFLFSDGFQDQFGGPSGKKLGSAHFKEMLLAACKENFAGAEKRLHTSLKEWQGNEEQTDDILVIGIKI
ncbi:MAG TPA: SpoIIE family protein phosphatase [Bacteroidia bacterium]|jgi:serine phosphatase RsbU (regulator of sigma subunit)|nr:SpoIIE family protein phosphatase [Bacteroidia bacterium]